MRNVKLNPLLILLAVILLILIARFIWRLFHSTNDRIIELELQVARDVELLQLSKEQGECLINKAIKVYRMTVITLFTVFTAILFFTVYIGYSYMDALEIHLGSVGIIIAFITTVFYNTWNPDVLLKQLKDRVISWIYQRNGFNPSDIEEIQSRVKIAQAELNGLKGKNPSNLNGSLVTIIN